MLQSISALGLLVFVFLAWLLSSNRGAVQWRLVVSGLMLQLVLAALILWTTPGQWIFEQLGAGFNWVLGCVNEGSRFVFSLHPSGTPTDPEPGWLLGSFAFGVLPTVVVVSSLMEVLYFFGVMQWIVSAFSWVMRWTLKTSGAESLAAAANIFVGQTEAPLVIRPYIPNMTNSELHSLMVGGFATVSGGVLAAFVGMGIDPTHLLTASVISAPAALVIAKIIQPETEVPETAGTVEVDYVSEGSNPIEAATIGASAGMKLALNIGAMLIAFIALIAMADAGLAGIGSLFGYTGDSAWSLSSLLGYVCAPIAWVMGIASADCLSAGELLGLKLVTNEFIAYERLVEWMQPDSEIVLSERSNTIMIYALSGFSNFGAIGVQIGGIGEMAPSRRKDLARLGLKAMFGGAIACCMTACIAGILVA
ncbi:NupC/NupG family nucleoside CNT transporter [Thalassoroseus pseudoceratinae]|uniref:NupC/NupG family nucleoside CNT transporter n=1 Tax=Thalassoroseus pseudoceratinae TaxID=2713176 RepID=UPI00141DB07D|nr:nucleoside transporter C-terminal domain-containing protein [Thalassoroseus pseudoceratinae]